MSLKAVCFAPGLQINGKCHISVSGPMYNCEEGAVVSSGKPERDHNIHRGRSRLARAEPCKKFKIEKQFLSRLLPAFLDRNVSGSSEWKKLMDGEVVSFQSGMSMLMKMVVKLLMMMHRWRGGGQADLERREIEGRRYKICPAEIHSIPNPAICRYNICPAEIHFILN